MSKNKPSKNLIRQLIPNALWDGIKLVFQLAGGAGILTGLLSAILHYLQSVPLNLQLIGGVFACSFLFMILAFVAGRFQHVKRKAESVSISQQAQPTTATNTNVIKEQCPDKWLHEIADGDKRFIDQRVKVERCELVRHNLLHTAPYVDFKFTILNSSVYEICIGDSIKGEILFNSQILSGGIKIVGNAATYCRHGDSKDFTVRQWLSREEVACILTDTDDAGIFRFGSLDITIHGISTESQINPKKLDVYALCLSSKPLRELYKKLEIEIQQSTFVGHFQFIGLQDRGLLVNLHIRILNPRPVRAEVQNFRVLTEINGNAYVQYAEIGDIYEGRFFNEEGIEEVRGRKLRNINPSNGSLLLIEPKQTCEGWLQFHIKDVGFDEPQKLPATLEVIDAYGEKHSAECSLLYQKP